MDRIILSILWIFISQILGLGVSAKHAHKVHNLILYPNKHEWCEARDIEMVVTHPGCTPKEFNNRVCVGQCFSYTSPKTKPANQVEDKLQYCDFCAPANTTWEKIVLDCDTDRYTTFEKEVELIHDCACTACHPEQEHGEESAHDGYVYEYDVESPYAAYDVVDDDANIAHIAQDSLRSEDVKLAQDGQRYREFHVNADTLGHASRVPAASQHHHVTSHHRRYNNHDPQSRQWIINSNVHLEDDAG